MSRCPDFRKSGADDVRKLRYFEDSMSIHEELHVESISFQYDAHSEKGGFRETVFRGP